MSGDPGEPGPDQLLRPGTCLAVVLGASEWGTRAQLASAPSFRSSAAGVLQYLTRAQGGLGIPTEMLLNLFDSRDVRGEPLIAEAQISRVSDFLSEQIVQAEMNGTPITDVFVYAVGHGVSSPGEPQELQLAVHTLVSGQEDNTGLSLRKLARALHRGAPRQRRYVILDCCLSGRASTLFQSPGAVANLTRNLIQSAADEVNGQDYKLEAVAARLSASKTPGAKLAEIGTALLCSSSAEEPSIAVSPGKETLFTWALLDTLQHSESQGGSRISLATLRSGIWSAIQRVPGGKPYPELHAPRAAPGWFELLMLPLLPRGGNATAADLRARIVPSSEAAVPSALPKSRAAVLTSAARPFDELMPDKLAEMTLTKPITCGSDLIGCGDVIERWAFELAKAEENCRFVLYGPAGTGKTRIVEEITRHLAVVQKFSHRIEWSGAGQRSRPAAVLQNGPPPLGQSALGRGMLPRPSGVTGTRVAPGGLILVVIDDARGAEDWEDHLRESGRVYLAVTDKQEVAGRFVRGEASQWIVPRLSMAEGVRLVEREAGRSYEGEQRRAVERLSERVDQVPLALLLIGRNLVHRRDTPLQFERAVQANIKLQLYPLAAVIRYCVSSLNRVERSHLRALSLFREKPNSFSVLTAFAAMNAGREGLEALTKMCLVEWVEEGDQARCALHPEIARHARDMPGQDSAHMREVVRRVMRHLTRFAENNHTNFSVLLIEQENLRTSLLGARRIWEDDPQARRDREVGELLVRCANALSEFWLAQGLNEFGAEFLRLARNVAEALDSEVPGLDAKHATHLEKLGRYAEAEQALQRYESFVPDDMSCTLHERDRVTLAKSLYIRSIVLYNLTRLGDAETVIGRGLLLLGWPSARLIELKSRIRDSNFNEAAQVLRAVCDLLERRCLVAQSIAKVDEGVVWNQAIRHPRWAEAQQSAMLGTRIALRLGDPSRLAVHLLNLSWLLLHSRNISRAKRVAKFGLELTLEISFRGLATGFEIAHRELVTGFLHRLGAAAAEQGLLIEAERQLEEALRMATNMQHRWYEAFIRTELGYRVHMREAGPERAYRASIELIRAMWIAGWIGSRNLEGDAAHSLRDALGRIWPPHDASKLAGLLRQFGLHLQHLQIENLGAANLISERLDNLVREAAHIVYPASQEETEHYQKWVKLFEDDCIRVKFIVSGVSKSGQAIARIMEKLLRV